MHHPVPTTPVSVDRFRRLWLPSVDRKRQAEQERVHAHPVPTTPESVDRFRQAPDHTAEGSLSARGSHRWTGKVRPNSDGCPCHDDDTGIGGQI